VKDLQGGTARCEMCPPASYSFHVKKVFVFAYHISIFVGIVLTGLV
jgi:hypothetical protein